MLPVEKNAAAVGKLHVSRLHFVQFSIGADIAAGLHNVLHLTAVSAGIHEQRAADGTRYPIREFQPAEGTVPREDAHPLQRRPCPCGDFIPADDCGDFARRQVYHAPAVAL